MKVKLVKLSACFFDDWETRCLDQFSPVEVDELVSKRSGSYVYLNPNCDRFKEILEDIWNDAFYYSDPFGWDEWVQKTICRSAQAVLRQIRQQY